jgi:hypothetical protein
MPNKILLILIIIVTGCTDKELELPPGNSLVVVEGWLTDLQDTQWVKLSQTTPISSEDAELIIEDALVEIIEDGNPTRIPLAFNPETNRYHSEVFAGVHNKRYSLEVTLSNGDIIRSKWETLQAVPPIDAIEFDFFEDTDPATGEDILVYYPIVISQDPAEEINNYRYKGFRNGQVFKEPEALILLSDEFNNGQTLPHHIPDFRLELGDEIKVEIQSISPLAYRFLDLLKSQTLSVGSSSGTAPAKLIGNLTNVTSHEIVLGYFGAVSVHSFTTTVSE